MLRGEVKDGQSVRGRDYRMEAVLGVVRAVPGTDWFLVAKLDRKELYQPAVHEAVWIALAGMLGLFVLAVAAKLLRQKRELAQAEVLGAAQTERLAALQLLSSVVDASRDAIFAKDRQGRYTLFNSGAENLTGRPRADVLGRDDRILFPEGADRIMAVDRQIMASGEARSLEETYPSPAGPRHLHITKGALTNPAGETVGIYGIARDITERMAAEAALRESEAKYRLLAEYASDWIFWTAPDGSFRYVSPACESLTGHKPEEFLAGLELLMSLIHPEDRENYANHLRHLDDPEHCELEFRLVGKEDRLLWISHQCKPMYDEMGNFLGRRGSNRDISARKGAEQELLARNEELERFNEVAVGRELDMIGLKQTVNELSTQLGRQRPFALEFLDHPAQEEGA